MRFVYSARFKKRYRKLPEALQDRADVALSLLRSGTRGPGLNDHPLSGRHAGYRSINVTGDLRIVYERRGVIGVLVDIGTHSELYGK